ncbi:MAG TPA: flagellar biosynthetic protein FliQ [Acetobacteraceae bacterium]|nr:flagellar biosynthetic protein FliQ [Acetobacteraceae bacterium]
MHDLDVVAFLHSGMLTTLKLCAPLLVGPLIAGLATAMFQAVTQISDATLSFIPKLCATLAAAYYAGPFLASTLTDYMHQSFANIVLVGGQ